MFLKNCFLVFKVLKVFKGFLVSRFQFFKRKPKDLLLPELLLSTFAQHAHNNGNSRTTGWQLLYL